VSLLRRIERDALGSWAFRQASRRRVNVCTTLKPPSRVSVERIMMRMFALITCVAVAVAAATAAEDTYIPKGATVYIGPQGGFEKYLSAAILQKGVPILIVADREKADFEITGLAKYEKASPATTQGTRGTWSRQHAIMTVTNLKTGRVVYAYAYHMGNPFKGHQSAAESCAKHLKARIEKGK